jgi:acyl carrier protein
MSSKQQFETDQSTGSDLRNRVASILSDVLQTDIDPAAGEIPFTEIPEWDSVNHLRLVLELEETFDISLSDEEVLEMNSLQRLVDIVARHDTAGG